MDSVIETRHLTKRFGKFIAVDDISISVGRGEIYGFLGLNGAGKTTTIRMLLGMVRATDGECFLKGTRIAAGTTAIWNSVGYLVEIPYAYPELTVEENLESVRRLRSVSDANAVKVIMEKLNIGQYKNRPARNLSLGNAQRLGLAKALMHHPEILILDEPANGLDPAGIVEIRELLHALAKEEGVTILVSSHILGEVARFATRIGIIHRGKMLQEATTDELVEYRTRRLVLRVADNERAVSLLARKSVAAGVGDDGLLEITDSAVAAHPETVNEMLVLAGCTPSMLRVDEEDLESYFLRVVGNNGGAS